MLLRSQFYSWYSGALLNHLLTGPHNLYPPLSEGKVRLIFGKTWNLNYNILKFHGNWKRKFPLTFLTLRNMNQTLFQKRTVNKEYSQIDSNMVLSLFWVSCCCCLHAFDWQSDFCVIFHPANREFISTDVAVDVQQLYQLPHEHSPLILGRLFQNMT